MSDIVVRAAQIEDAPTIAGVHVASWTTTYAELLAGTGGRGSPNLEETEAQWRDRIPRIRDEGYRTWVAERDGDIAGYAFTQPTEDDDLDPLEIAELRALYLHPDHQGAGIGKLLLDKAVAGMRSQGFLQATLWVIDDNDGAIRFYRREGWRPDGKRSSCYRVLDAPAQRMKLPL